jgi:putative ABC transport system ATP-binding protein
MSAGVLEIDHLQTSLSDGDRRFRVTLEGLRLRAGEIVGLTGASGAGKTLVLELLGLLRQPDADTRYRWLPESGPARDLGALWCDGPRSRHLAAGRGRMFGFVPQSGGLLPFLTVAENVRLPQLLVRRPDPDWCAGLLERLGLSAVADLRPGALSIGQRQRCAIARALAHRPPFVIADEPTAALDPDSADGVLDLLLQTARIGGAGVILSSHDIARIDRLGIPRLRISARTEPDGAVASSLEAA